jgi:hypothetical protein
VILVENCFLNILSYFDTNVGLSSVVGAIRPLEFVLASQMSTEHTDDDQFWHPLMDRLVLVLSRRPILLHSFIHRFSFFVSSASARRRTSHPSQGSGNQVFCMLTLLILTMHYRSLPCSRFQTRFSHSLLGDILQRHLPEFFTTAATIVCQDTDDMGEQNVLVSQVRITASIDKRRFQHRH